jgi:hypothetical protein
MAVDLSLTNDLILIVFLYQEIWMFLLFYCLENQLGSSFF